MKNAKRMAIFGILMFCFYDCYSSTSVNYLTKVFHHKGQVSYTVSCYFSVKPICTPLPQRVNAARGWQRHDFFFPMAQINNECRKVINELNQMKADKQNTTSHSYTIAIKEVKKPIPGILMSIEYNKDTLGFEYQSFAAAIQEQPGLVFKFYNKKVLHELGRKTDKNQQYVINKKTPHVVIDSGHGDEDFGKVGCFGLKEKDINLAVAKKVARLLRNEGILVSLTREADRFVALDQRTSFANNKVQADLFVSIHANGAPAQHACGIETFCTQSHLFTPEISDGDTHTLKLMKAQEAYRSSQSCKLAQHVHDNVLLHAKQMQRNVKDRKVKNAISQVLLGTDMPSTLIEIGFLSNEHEAKLLTSPAYQETIARGICKGILSYVSGASA